MNATLTSSYSTTVNKYDVSGIFAGMSIKLHEIRALSGLNQAQVAERLDATQPFVSKLERHKDFRMSALAAYLDAVGATARLVVDVNDQTLTYLVSGGEIS